jgi:hypothetical protein
MSSTSGQATIDAGIAPRGEKRSGKVRLAAAAGLGVVAAALLALAILGREPAVFQPGTPEHAFQSYYTAWEAEDLDAAYAWFSRDVQATMTLAEYRRYAREQWGWSRDDTRRIVLEGIDRAGTRATLRIRVEHFSAGGLGGNRYSYALSFRLVENDGAWFIDEPLAGLEPLMHY